MAEKQSFVPAGFPLSSVLRGRPERRAVLRWAAATAGALWTAPLALTSCGGVRAGTSARRGVLLGPGSRSAASGPQAEELLLALLDLDAPEPRVETLELAFMAHGVVVDPHDPQRVVLFEKRGRGACEVHLAAREVVRPIETAAGREFYGHGAFSPDGTLLYSTETQVDDGYRGLVAVRDARTFEPLGEFPSHGLAPHDCALRDGGKTMVITNGGGRHEGTEPGCVTYVDVASERLIEKLEFAPAVYSAGHLALTARGDLAVSSAAREWMPKETLGAASFRTKGGRFRTMTEPPELTTRMLGESLSLAIHEPSATVGITNPAGHLVTFWDLGRSSLLGSLDLPYPRGIAVTLDGGEFVVSYGKGTSLLGVSPRTLEPTGSTTVSPTFMTGSHVYVHELPQA